MSETPKPVLDAIYAMEDAIYEAFALAEAAAAVESANCEPNTQAFINHQLCDRVIVLRDQWKAIHTAATAGRHE